MGRPGNLHVQDDGRVEPRFPADRRRRTVRVRESGCEPAGMLSEITPLQGGSRRRAHDGTQRAIGSGRAGRPGWLEKCVPQAGGRHSGGALRRASPARTRAATQVATDACRHGGTGRLADRRLICRAGGRGSCRSARRGDTPHPRSLRFVPVAAGAGRRRSRARGRERARPDPPRASRLCGFGDARTFRCLGCLDHWTSSCRPVPRPRDDRGGFDGDAPAFSKRRSARNHRGRPMRGIC
jgi:hypothetical protein